MKVYRYIIMANFIAWYLGKGVAEWSRFWKNTVRIAWRFFDAPELLATLFSSWRRDVSFPDWRGFHPIKVLNMISINLLTRLIGSLARMVTLLFGLFACGFLILFGFISWVMWISWPVLFFTALLLFFWSFAVGFGLLTLLGATAFAALKLYQIVGTPLPDQLDWDGMLRQPWFERVLFRLGIPDEERDTFRDPEQVSSIIDRLQIPREVWIKIVTREAMRESRNRKKPIFWSDERVQQTLPIGRFWKYGYTVRLDRYSLDLSQHDPTNYQYLELFGRDTDLEMLELDLTRPNQNSVLLIGDHGIGKRTMIHTLARHLRENHARYRELRDTRILWFDFERAMADIVDQGGDAELALYQIFYEATYAGNVVIVIENLVEHLLETDSRAGVIASVLLRYLSMPTFRLIAFTTSNEKQRLQKERPGVMKYFETLTIQEPDIEATTEILYQYFDQVETSQVAFTHKSFQRVIELAGRYDWEHPYPERAITLAEAALNWWLRDKTTPVITTETIDEFVAQKTGMPIGQITEDEKTKLLKLEGTLHQRIIGQDEAINQLSEALRKARTGIGNSKRPIASFLFLGPTGVGKTETVKAIAESFFGDETRMIRLDMSEFQGENSIDRLIGSTRGGERLGFLTAQVKDHPFSILLLDELEKASPDVLDLFLQVLEDGFLTDGFGERINFRNMIIAATSNAGSILIKQSVEEGLPSKELQKKLVDTLVGNGVFRLEFLNRFDGIIFFQPLNDTELQQVAGLQLRQLTKRIEQEKNIRISFDPGVIAEVIQKGYEPMFGARSLRRFIENSIEDVIVRKILNNEVKEGQEVTVIAEDIK